MPLNADDFVFLLSLRGAQDLGIGLTGPSGLTIHIGVADVRLIRSDKVCVITRTDTGFERQFHRIDNGYHPLDDPAFTAQVDSLFDAAVEVGRNRVARQQADRERARTERIDPVLDEIATAVTPDPAVRAALLGRLAVLRRDPEHFLDLNRERYSKLGIDALVPDFGWTALVVELLDAGVAIEVDWRDEWEDVQPMLDGLITASKIAPIAWPPGMDGLSTAEALNAAARAVSGTGWFARALGRCPSQLIQFDTGTDTFVVAVAPGRLVKRLRALARQVGHEIKTSFR